MCNARAHVEEQILLSLEHGRVSEEEISTVGLIVTLHSELNQFS